MTGGACVKENNYLEILALFLCSQESPSPYLHDLENNNIMELHMHM